jgi:hypothetical protein
MIIVFGIGKFNPEGVTWALHAITLLRDYRNSTKKSTLIPDG